VVAAQSDEPYVTNAAPYRNANVTARTLAHEATTLNTGAIVKWS
jgi:hypothetical protein